MYVLISVVRCSMPMAAVLHLLSSDVIFYICSFLEAKFLLQSVSLVCKRFYHILSDVEFWRARLREQWQKKYPLVPGEVFASSLGFQHNNLLFAGYKVIYNRKCPALMVPFGNSKL